MITRTNLYWEDLSEEGKENLLDSGFKPTKEQLAEEEPIGILKLEA